MWTTPFKYWRWPKFLFPNFGSPSWRCCSSCCISAGYRRPDTPVLIYLTLPAIAIGFRQAGNTTRLTRSSMLNEMNTEYVDTARSPGFRERKAVYKFTLRNAMFRHSQSASSSSPVCLAEPLSSKQFLLDLASAASFTKRSSSETTR